MWRMLKEREIGRLASPSFMKIVQKRRVQNIGLASDKEIVSAHKSGINSLQIDFSEARYLIAGASDGSVGVYDIQQASNYEYTLNTRKHEALFLVDRQVPRGHAYSVSSVHWYPIDTGIFITGSFDHFVNVWDTNTTQVELQFNMSKKVYAISMSVLATAHMLIATGTEDAKVRLCDMASGAFTHTLTGHRESVWAVQWSCTSEWVLVTGGCDGAIRFWDIRRAGCYKVLDQHCSQIGRRPPLSKPSSENLEAIRMPVSKKKKCQKENGGARDLCVAHYGSVTGLQMTSDGMFLLSAGTDSSLRLWDVESGCNTLVHFPLTRIRGNKGTQMAISLDSTLVFTPSANVLKAYDIWTGQTNSVLRGHYDLVNCCTFYGNGQELYSGSNDRQILVWSHPSFVDSEDMEPVGKLLGAQPDEDAWSD